MYEIHLFPLLTLLMNELLSQLYLFKTRPWNENHLTVFDTLSSPGELLTPLQKKY